MMWNLQAIMYAIICTHNKSHNNNENENSVSLDTYESTERIR